MTPSHSARAIARLAARQHGYVTTAQLTAAGLTRHQIATRVRHGWLIRRHVGVYAVGHVPRTLHARLVAAVLALGVDATASHRAGGAVWEVVRGPVPVEVIVPTHAGVRSRDGIVVHRIPLRDDERTVRDGVPVTSLVRTVLDLAAVQRVRQVEWTFEEAQVRHHLHPEVLAAAAVSRRGCRGTAHVWTVLDGAVDPAGVASRLELRFLRLCAAHGIERPEVNVEQGVWTPDFHWPRAGVIVETDGGEFHRTVAARRRDARKDRALSAGGTSIMRLDWADVVDDPAATAARVRRLLAAPR